MTNGEMIQSMFPNMNFGTLAQDDVIVNKDYSNNDEPQVFIPKKVWNAEYKEPNKSKNLTSSIIKSGISKSIIYKAKESKEIQEDLDKLSKLNEPITKNNLIIDDEERTLALMYLEQIKDDYIEGTGYEKHPLPEYYAIETAIKSLALLSVTRNELNDSDEDVCEWIKCDYRTVAPKNHYMNNPYWLIPENKMDAIKYCPYCGKKIEVTE
jgi:hypothetical protein